MLELTNTSPIPVPNCGKHGSVYTGMREAVSDDDGNNGNGGGWRRWLLAEGRRDASTELAVLDFAPASNPGEEDPDDGPSSNRGSKEPVEWAGDAAVAAAWAVGLWPFSAAPPVPLVLLPPRGVNKPPDGLQSKEEIWPVCPSYVRITFPVSRSHSCPERKKLLLSSSSTLRGREAQKAHQYPFIPSTRDEPFLIGRDQKAGHWTPGSVTPIRVGRGLEYVTDVTLVVTDREQVDGSRL
jgi:hypothetical protein